MKKHRRETACIACLLLCCALPLHAAEQPAGNAEDGDLRSEIEELQRKLAELEKKHASEIRMLKERIEALARAGSGEGDRSEIEALRLRAAADAAAEDQKAEDATYASGAIAQQALNPELSVTGDMFAYYRSEAEEALGGAQFRNFGVHFESYLDPYTRFKTALEFGEEVELGEAYFIRYGLMANFNLTLGKFRQQFGVVNRWHKHGLDQLDFPLPLRQIFGEGGLNQVGAAGEWTVATEASVSHGVDLQITNGENDRLFGWNSRNIPSVLLRYHNYRDLSKDIYLDIGASGLTGWNDEWPVASGDGFVQERETLRTSVYGLDATLLWEPTDRMRYRNLVWRTEAYLLDRSLRAPDGSGRDGLRAWGTYSYLQSLLSRSWEAGLRLDYYEPAVEPYADIAGYLYPHAVTQEGAKLWQVSPYVTWYQSPWVRFRMEYDRQGGKFLPVDDQIVFQAIFSAGPHKHERY